ncbi:hypothetical protein NPIL_80931 [Nephila pilipes]|uniref:Secreted protein n=1 Tax=Nephila pilipes TaxID=299642 RepID=A0A8X6MD01_NEPPI|nr:hypothetical protein NPIL_80931 [Nephila pilipes]
MRRWFRILFMIVTNFGRFLLRIPFYQFGAGNGKVRDDLSCRAPWVQKHPPPLIREEKEIDQSEAHSAQDSNRGTSRKCSGEICLNLKGKGRENMIFSKMENFDCCTIFRCEDQIGLHW